MRCEFHAGQVDWTRDISHGSKSKSHGSNMSAYVPWSIGWSLVPRTFPRMSLCFFTGTVCSIIVFFCFFFSHFYSPASGQAVVTGVVPSPPRFLPSIFIAHRVQQSHCSTIFHRVLLTHALALSASQFVHKKKSQRIYTSLHSAGLELTKLTYTRLEDNLIRHRGDRIMLQQRCTCFFLGPSLKACLTPKPTFSANQKCNPLNKPITD